MKHHKLREDQDSDGGVVVVSNENNQNLENFVQKYGGNTPSDEVTVLSCTITRDTQKQKQH